jgi:NAD(P)-dependent dehydrogenase (short-subunit alcohol dehydrogenase family)
MRIVVFGGSGTIGSAVTSRLTEAGHEVITASRSREQKVDTTDPESVQALFQRLGEVDAVVSAIGGGPFAPTPEATPEQVQEGLSGKLAGQMNLVIKGLPYIRDAGSFTLTSGILNAVPVRGGAIAAAINGGLESFVHVASHELPRDIRLNAISPTVLEESLDKYGPVFPGFEPTTGRLVADAFLRSVEGLENGKVIRIW